MSAVAFWCFLFRIWQKSGRSPPSRTGLTLWQTGKRQGPRAWISYHCFTDFSCIHVFRARLFTTRQNCSSFWLLRL